jgi:hypothetical protein
MKANLLVAIALLGSFAGALSAQKQGVAWLDSKGNLRITTAKGKPASPSDDLRLLLQNFVFDVKAKIARPAGKPGVGQELYERLATPVSTTTILGEDLHIGTLFYMDGTIRDAVYGNVALDVSDLQGKKHDLPVFGVVTPEGKYLCDVRLVVLNHKSITISSEYQVYADGLKTVDKDGPFVTLLFENLPPSALKVTISRNDKLITTLPQKPTPPRYLLGGVAKTNDAVQWRVIGQQDKVLLSGFIGFPIAGLGRDLVEYVVDLSPEASQRAPLL